MKTSAIIRIIIYSLLIVILSGILVFGITSEGLSWNMISFNIGSSSGLLRNGTQANSMSFEANDIEEIVVLWVNGEVAIASSDKNTISYETTNDHTDLPTVYKLENGRLTIGFTNKTGSFGNTGGKSLTLSLPQNWAGKYLRVDSVSADVNVKNIANLSKAKFDNVSGEIHLVNFICEEMEISTVSGHMNLYCHFNEAKIDAVSANCTITLLGNTSPEALSFNSVSGNFELSIPNGCGFDLELDGLKKELETDMKYEKKGEHYICTGVLGTCDLDVDTVSGHVKIGYALFSSSCSHLWAIRTPLNAPQDENPQSTIYECQICGALKIE